MKVRCTSNSGMDLPDLYLDAAGGYAATTTFELERSKEYVVYALTIRRGGIWYYILDETGTPYPIWNPAPLFEVVDPRMSRYWTFGFTEDGLRAGSAIFAFGEWARNPADYYDRLTDGEVRAEATFAQFRELLDLEFADSSVQRIAEEMEDGWLLCPYCRESWRTLVRGEMVRCANCKKVLRNPALEAA